MMSIKEFSALTKPKMVVALIEAMVFGGWDITNIVYGFKAYKKFELINRYQDQINYARKTT